MNIFMRFFTWMASFFDSAQSTSSRRLQSFVILVVLCIGNIHFFFWCLNAWYQIIVIGMDMVYILLMYGLVTFQQLAELKTGIKVTESTERTAKGTTTSVEKTVTDPVKSADQQEVT